MTEFDIPTGPLATVVYIAVAPDAAKIWFTEWASNRIAYLDNTLAVPLDLNATKLYSILSTCSEDKSNISIRCNGD